MSKATATNDEPPPPLQQPKLTKDPRFRAARKLIESGRDGAIEMFGTLLEEARTKYGEASIETAPAYFEYGGALFRESQRQQQQQAEKNAEEEEGDEEEEDKKPAAVVEDKQENGDNKSEEKGENEEEAKKEDEADDAEEEEVEEDPADGDDEEEEEEGEEEEDDEQLAFAMMETAFSIYDQYVQLAKSSPAANSAYLEWAERVQLPRVLSNIGDLLASMGRHADAADTYTRELHFREVNLQRYENQEMSLEELTDRRKGVEANVLVATELLECEPGKDVITTETKSCLAKAAEREDFATGYYDAARDQLQDTVYLMAKLIAAAKGKDKEKSNAGLDKEKENICFASTLVMSVGEQLARIKEEKEEANGPAKKKAKL